MPALAPVPKTMRVTFTQHLGEDTRVMNRLYYKYSGTSDQGSQNQFGTAMLNAWTSHLTGILHTTLILVMVTIADLDSEVGLVTDVPTNTPGTNGTTAAVPAQDCALNNARILRHYRGGKPRWYQSGWLIGYIHDEQTWDASAIGTWEAAFNLFVSTPKNQLYGNMSVTDNVNVSYYKGHEWSGPVPPTGKYVKTPTPRTPPITDVISDWYMNPHIASQRRRSQIEA